MRLKVSKYQPVWIIVLLWCTTISAQQFSDAAPADTLAIVKDKAPAFIIGSITITGNKKTKDFIILREIPFRTGEEYTLQDLVKKFEDGRKQLLNTTLFHTVVVAARNFEGNKVHVSVAVRERWYLFPLPYLKPVDRNLNQWIIEQKASLSRVNYGAKLMYNNATGRNDKLRMWLINGYTKQVSFSYDRLYIDKALKWGMKVSFAAGKNREVNYNTINDKQVFLKDNENFVRNFLNTSAELTYRRAIKTRHSIGVAFSREEVGDTIVALNPGYFKAGRNSIQFPELYYNMTYLDLDYIPYPTRGYAAQVFLGKRGFNSTINLWQLHVKGSGSWHIYPKTFFNLNLYGGVKLPFKQPYFNQRFLGYGDVFMQGYEYFVIDGVAGGYLKTTLTREIFNFNVKMPKIKGRTMERIPVRIFAKAYGNAGYVHNPQPGDNLLSNKMLYSGGIGIDILTMYDVTFRFEYSFNQLGQSGFFLHRKTIF
ncbi:MAG TPA: POTRA domain-containing protein [Chitinophagaceae bacterium]|nr:POTRA domain-containing protein [Chitinophagaceae bacterium]